MTRLQIFSAFPGFMTTRKIFYLTDILRIKIRIKIRFNLRILIRRSLTQNITSFTHLYQNY